MLKILFGSQEKTLKIGNTLLHCYILDNKQQVITGDSFQKVLGYEGKSEIWLLEFLTSISRFTPIQNELLLKIKTPLSAITIINGNEKEISGLIDATYIVQSCLTIVKAKEDGYLNLNQLKYAKSASIVLEKLQNTTIESLINEATGFNWHREKAIEKVIQVLLEKQNDDAYFWIQTIPKHFIDKILDLNSLNWKTVFEKPTYLAKISDEIIYSRISNEILDNLRTLKPKRTYTRSNNKKQDNEHPELQKHIIALESLLIASDNDWSIFIQLLNKTFPKQKNRPLTEIEIQENVMDKSFSDFNEKLIKTTEKRKL